MSDTAITSYYSPYQIGFSSAPVEQLKGLTSRQQMVLGLMSKGKANKEIANELAISESTVKAHVSAILKKLGANNRVQAVLMATDVFNIAYRV